MVNDMNKSHNSGSKLVEIFLVIYGTVLLFNGIYNHPSELFVYLGLTNQFLIILIAIAFLLIPFASLKVHKKGGDKITFVIVSIATAGLNIIGKNMFATIIGVILFLSSIIIYQLSKKK